MKEKICDNCRFWQPNGGVLKMGYCVANKWTYRKPYHTCEKFEEGTVYAIHFTTFDEEGNATRRAVRIKAATEGEARAWLLRRAPGAWGIYVEAER